MNRCLQLANLGAGTVAPNPLVGAVLVYNHRIIGEGYHQKYGEAHAEVNCINSVAEIDQPYISQATLYVSLEPCAHHGKTPPCADLIVKHQIKNVVVACRDSFDAVNGKGIEKLINAGIAVKEGVMQMEAIDLNKRFFTFHTHKRPYIILKWAESSNGCIAEKNGSPVKISNAISNKLVHRWRSEEAAIVVGTNTAANDNPALTDRLWKGTSQPVRIVIDEQLRLRKNLQLFDHTVPTIVVNRKQSLQEQQLNYIELNPEEDSINGLVRILFEQRLNSVIVEGGAKLLQSYIDLGLWDEARVIKSKTIVIEDGIKAPILAGAELLHQQHILQDEIQFYKKGLVK